MFRPLLDHLQALWENRSKSYPHFNALLDPKCLQVVLYECEIYKTATQIPIYTNLCISHSYNTICKHLGSHNALGYR